MRRLLMVLLLVALSLSAYARPCPDGQVWRPAEYGQIGDGEPGTEGGMCFEYDGSDGGGGSWINAGDSCESEAECSAWAGYFCGDQLARFWYELHICDVTCFNRDGEVTDTDLNVCWNPFEIGTT